jgi:hypothetical protein
MNEINSAIAHAREGGARTKTTMKAKPTNKTNPKPQPVNKEAFKMLAMEIGLNAACRKLSVPTPTGKSWARRGGWKLPKRPGGRPQRTIEASSLHPIADALDATHKELADTARTSILQAMTNAAKLVAKKPGLDVSTVAQLRDLALALVRLCDNGKPGVTVYSDKTMIVCDEKRRTELIEQRQRLLEQEATQASGRKVETAAPAALPAPETQCSASAGTENSTVAHDPSPDVHFQHMQSIGKAKTWKTSEPENHGGGGSFGPYPEEYE